eukprot:391766-Karenia_brevis.AAC.1
MVAGRRKTFERKENESRVVLSSSYGCGGECDCGKGGGQQDENRVQLVGVDEEAKKIRLRFQVAAVSKPLLAAKRIV